ncbi:Hypothetical protein R9X50_00180700 [Acrodontium crateriforme]|uniref:Major facilitator superfamily (MFS) profile domain-containing protein n=1 Tax=Acrodontium crateriforme TaxID=150365 RepID=A0AAQ3M336_9PEZI|nr:Hypothetical protein R9X50_00180700 [Acrodontium crateriforme]
MAKEEAELTAAVKRLSDLTSQATPNDGTPVKKKTLTEEDAYGVLAFSWPRKKKWGILTVVFLIQISMNFNAAIYGNAVPGMLAEFGITNPIVSRLGQFIFLVMYGIGCELWAPWSEELGRWWPMFMSLLLVNVWQIPSALAPTFWVVFAARLLGGVSSAGGSVTLGLVADMYEVKDQQSPLNFIVLSSCAGSVVAPMAGGFITEYLPWQDVFWVTLALGGLSWSLWFCVPETRPTILLDIEAQRRRKADPTCNAYGPNEIRGNLRQRINVKDSMRLMGRPYKLLLTEPIVGLLSLLSGFSDALIFSSLDSLKLVMDQWKFTPSQMGMCFASLLLAYLAAYALFEVFSVRDRRQASTPEGLRPEFRLRLLLYVVPLETIGLFGLGWASLGPPCHWIVPLINVFLIGIANYAIYMATIDYMVAAYGPFAASATGGNGFARDVLAGIAALYTVPMYENILPGTKWSLVIPAMILSVAALLLCIPVYVFYFHGPYFRARSPYASQLQKHRDDTHLARERAVHNQSAPNSTVVSPRASIDEDRLCSTGSVTAFARV